MPTREELVSRLTGPGGAFEMVEEDVRGQKLRVFRSRLRSLRRLLEETERFGDRLYLIDGDVRLGFRDHLALVDRVARTLRDDYGVSAGDRVALFAANRWEWIVAFWATAWLGAVPVLMNGFWTDEEFADAAALAGPVLVVGDAIRFERVKAKLASHRTFALERIGEDPRAAGGSVDRESDAPGTSGPRGRESEFAVPSPDVAEDDPAYLIFTSGTTGRAKAVTVPHRAACGFNQVSALTEAIGRGLAGMPLPQPGAPAPPSDEVVLVTSPLFHVSMLYGGVVMGAVKGFRMVLLPGRFDPERVLAAIERERVTLWMALGSAAPRTAEVALRTRYDLSSLRQLGIGGAPVSPAVQESLRRAFPVASRTLGMGYTSTEAGAVIASIGGPELERHPTSTGRLSIGTEVELRDEEGRVVAPGREGEVHVRSPYVMLGYWNDAKATETALKSDGWLAMGDVARFEGELLFINSRARDMLLVSAENVSPTEVEFCLEAHPQVVEAAVIGVDDATTGDAVCAVVVVDPANRPEAAALEQWCRQTLAHYKVPTRWHLTSEALPRTPSGKIVKGEVRRRVEASSA